jgi:hypothetical protein
MGNPEVYRLGGRLGNRLEENFERGLKEKVGSLCIELFCYGQTQGKSCSEYRKELWGSIKCEYFFLLPKGILTSSERLLCVELVLRFKYFVVLLFAETCIRMCSNIVSVK